ncbi:MAG: Gfo/Idh/MocA family oxidoreductase [Streptosporangiaceae bacterium]|nr:Gfo/Idh/MocA family oxidoreductase [Streptosporangiaceae bacterium]
MRPLRAGIVGCGVISREYVRTLAPCRQIRLVGAADIQRHRAEDLAESFGGKAYPTLDAMLADDDVDIIVNLTIQTEHAEVTERGLAAGKHVYSEKPLALSYAQARELLALAEHNRVRLSCAPMTFLGEAQQTAWQVIHDGRLGTIRMAYADMNWGRPETWHNEPRHYYEVGPLYDIGVYSLTVLTTFFGPARSATGLGRILAGERVTAEGDRFQVTNPDFVVALIEFGNGVVARLTTDFYVGHATKQKGIEFHGDLGSLWLGNPQHFNAAVQFAPYGGEFEPVPYIRDPYPGTEWSRGLVELADAIIDERPHRVTGEHAAHIVEILNAIDKGGDVQIRSGFAPPEPLLW